MLDNLLGFATFILGLGLCFLLFRINYILSKMPSRMGMGQKGQLTGAFDRHGNEIRIGDRLRFDSHEWNRTAPAGEHEDCVFTMKYENGSLVHPGSYSDLSEWCEIIDEKTDG